MLVGQHQNNKMTKINYFDLIDQKSDAIIRLGRQLSAISSKFQAFDLFLIGALNRTVNINKAFTTLSRDNNFIAAAALTRINMDTLLRICARHITEFDSNTFASKVMAGEHIRRMKAYDSNNKLTDTNLVNRVSQIKDMEWVKKIYESGNAFVHFSDDIIAASRTIINENERQIGLTIGYHDSFISEDIKLGATIWMDKIIDSIIEQAQLWMYEKCKTVGFDYEKLGEIK